MTAPTAGAADPAAVVERLLHGVTSRLGTDPAHLADLANLYAPDAVVEHPFDPGGSTPLRGREDLRAHFAAGARLPVRMRPRNVVTHRTTDPEVVVVEFEYHGEVTTTGRQFISPCVFVVRVRDGLIVSSRDYADHAAITAALTPPA